MTTVNTGGHLGPISGLYGLRAITATSYWLWQIACQSLGNPSKLVIYLFGILLTLSRLLYPAVSPPSLSLPHSFIFAASLFSPVFPCLPPTLTSLSFILLSVGFLLLVYPRALLSLLPLFSSMPPTRSKTLPLFILLLLLSLTSLFLSCSPSSPYVFHFSHLYFSCFSSFSLISTCFFLTRFYSSFFSLSIWLIPFTFTPSGIFLVPYLSVSSYSFCLSLTSFLISLSLCIFIISDLIFPNLFFSSTFNRLFSHWPFPLSLSSYSSFTHSPQSMNPSCHSFYTTFCTQSFSNSSLYQSL